MKSWTVHPIGSKELGYFDAASQAAAIAVRSRCDIEQQNRFHSRCRPTARHSGSIGRETADASRPALRCFQSQSRRYADKLCRLAIRSTGA